MKDFNLKISEIKKAERFTNWYKLHRRCGHWFAYHSVSFDV